MTHTEGHHSTTNTTAPVATPIATAASPIGAEKLSKLKLAFLYTLVGGLVASAIVAIVSILIGELNSASQRALGTIFIFVTHSLFILALIWSDKKNMLGRSIIPTTILGVTFANIVTSTLGNWGIITSETAWRSVLLYMLLIGTSFIITGALRLRIKHNPTNILLYSTVGSITAWTLALVPWVFEVVERFNPFYYRVVGALTILASTLFLVAIIIRSIAVARSKSTHVAELSIESAKKGIPGGMLAIYITVGVIASFVWFGGFIGFLVDGVEDTRYFDRNSTVQQK